MIITNEEAKAAFQQMKAYREGTFGWREAANIVDAFLDQPPLEKADEVADAMTIPERLREIAEGPSSQNCEHTDTLNVLTAVADEIERLQDALKEIEAVACGETQVAENDTDGLQWIWKRCQTSLTGGE